ncbi:MAG: PDDEXK nuclease domain-containing protein [Tannerellaceae bacterium]|jgi:predicted nuclease of restriction endonuclease-like (RecB) superfamily|nr:PDDEXK nuclease domain-containing protein [Tannerellaceae bacterium]
MNQEIDIQDYNVILRQIIAEIKSTRIVIANRINNSMVQMYWNIGRNLSEKGLKEGYGSQVVKKLSADLQYEFPGMSGFSPRNLWEMKRFYEFYCIADEKVQRCVALLPWRHNILIISKIKDIEEAYYYAESSIKMGWTRDVLLNFIKADTYRNSKILPKQHNFNKALPEHLQEQADEILKTTYNLDFLKVTTAIKERELEQRLVEKIKLFLLELGHGFTFIGNQHRLTLNKKEYAVDLLFFHRKLKSLIAIELKIGEFEPEYIGKMNHYLGLLDEQMRMPEENPSIGIILCADRDHVEVEMALRDFNKPIGVAEYQLQLPEKQLKDLISKEFEESSR